MSDAEQEAVRVLRYQLAQVEEQIVKRHYLNASHLCAAAAQSALRAFGAVLHEPTGAALR